jgi:uncharacterized protein
MTKLDWNSWALAEGLRCYRRGEFFAAHEHWETVWLKSQQPEKLFLQALIQVAAAFHHWQRNNSRGAESLLKMALRKLDAYPSRFEDVEAGLLRQDLERWQQVIAANEANGTGAQSPFPEIRFTVK